VSHDAVETAPVEIRAIVMPFAKSYFPANKDVGLRQYRPSANGGVLGSPA
jgi:hypothetical protein